MQPSFFFLAVVTAVLPWRMARALLTLLLLLVACAAPNGAETPPDGTGDIGNGDGPPERVFGTIRYYQEPVQVTVPETANVGEAFPVTVVTYGDSCTELGETDVRLEARRAEIRPYDYDIAPGQGCRAALRTFRHEATVVFTEAGEADVIFYGQQVDASGVTNTMVTETLEVLNPTPEED